jgi:crossover junction endodeoxyribonuclease RusA
VTFTVLGPPATKGSTVSFMGRDGRVVTKTDSVGLSSWTQAVGWAARGAGVRLATKPVGVRVRASFEFVAPKRLEKGRAHPTVKPDADKVLRALLDALTGVAYEDDAQVVDVAVTKRYGLEALTHVTIEEVR